MTKEKELDQFTLDVLKTFSEINRSIRIEPGNVVRVFNVAKTVVAEAALPDTFDVPCAFYNLPEFLTIVTQLAKTQKVTFGETHAIIKGEGSNIFYHYCDPRVVVYSEKKLQLPSVDYSATIDYEKLMTLKKASALMKMNDLVFRGSTVALVSNNRKDEYVIDMDEVETESEDEFTLDINLLCLHPCESYKVEISKKGMAKLTSNDGNLIYYIALKITRDEE